MRREIIHDKDTSPNGCPRADTLDYLLYELDESVEGRATSLPDVYPSAGLLTWCNILSRDGHENVKTF